MKTRHPLTNFGGPFMLSLAIAGCAIAPSAGPSASRVLKASAQTSVAGAGIQVVEVTDAIARRAVANSVRATFSEELGEGQAASSVVGRGDVLDIGIWEAPPAALFGATGATGAVSASGITNPLGNVARSASLPEQMVDSEGRISVPFAGRILAEGKRPEQIAREIDARLAGKAHQPQTIVRVVRTAAANVTVVGDVASSGRVPLTSRGERVLDILASAGGVKQPVGKMTIQITRGARVVALPLDTVIRDPLQNVRLQPDDVMTLLFQPFSFTALGAIGRNDEIPFEGTGLTLAQALGRISGLQDARADIKGVFIFRLEDPAIIGPGVALQTTPEGKVPVIYRVNLKDPATFFVAQSFPVRNKDVIYVSNSPLADIQKFVSVIYSTFLPVATTAAALKQ